MAGLTLLATGAAFLNMEKAKSEYEALVEKRDGVQAAISQMASDVDEYNAHKYDDPKDDPKDNVSLEDINPKDDESWEDIDTKEVDRPEGVKVTTLLRVANLVGKICYAKITTVLANTGDKPCYIRKISADCKVLGVPVILYKKGLKNLKSLKTILTSFDVMKRLNPGEILEISTEAGVSSFAEMQGEVRNMICEAAGKRLITSCGKLNMEDGEKADILLEWSESGRVNEKIYKCTWLAKPGTLRYCGEAGLS